jgi:hypothetical protein
VSAISGPRATIRARFRQHLNIAHESEVSVSREERECGWVEADGTGCVCRYRMCSREGGGQHPAHVKRLRRHIEEVHIEPQLAQQEHLGL